MADNAQKCLAIMRRGLLMRRLAILTAVMLSTNAAHAENITGDTVVLRALDKVTADTQDFKVKIGDTLKFGTLDVTVQHCEKTPPEERPETYAFLQIKDRGLKLSDKAKKKSKKTDEEPEPEFVFSGWMFASSPALSALDHPVYDIWVRGCTAKPNLRY